MLSKQRPKTEIIEKLISLDIEPASTQQLIELYMSRPEILMQELEGAQSIETISEHDLHYFNGSKRKCQLCVKRSGKLLTLFESQYIKDYQGELNAASDKIISTTSIKIIVFEKEKKTHPFEGKMIGY